MDINELIDTEKDKINKELTISKKDENSLIEVIDKKSMTSLSLSDVKIKINDNESYSKQANDIVDMMATVKAIEKKDVREKLIGNKANELTDNSETKANKAREDNIRSKTSLQEANRLLYEAVLESFGIFKHLPSWLMKILVFVFSPFYIVLTFIIGLPCSLVKIIINNLNGIFITYEDIDTKVKPKIKTIWWVIFSLVLLISICLTILKCLNKI